MGSAGLTVVQVEIKRSRTCRRQGSSGCACSSLRASSFHGVTLTTRVALGSCSEFSATLQRALLTTAHFLEVGVFVGCLDRRVEAHCLRRRASEVQAQSGQHVVMAHSPTPTEWSSDLSLESFVSQLLRHSVKASDEVAGAKPAVRDPASVALGEMVTFQGRSATGS